MLFQVAAGWKTSTEPLYSFALHEFRFVPASEIMIGKSPSVNETFVFISTFSTVNCFVRSGDLERSPLPEMFSLHRALEPVGRTPSNQK